LPELQITTEHLADRQLRLTILVPQERVEKARRESAKALSRNRRIPGYRPGAAPYAMVVDLIGQESIDEHAFDPLARDVVKEGLLKREIAPGGSVAVEIAATDPFTVKATVPLQPEVDLGDYRALRVPAPDMEPVTDEDVDRMIEAWRADLATLEPTEEPAVEGDQLSLEILGRFGDEDVFEAEQLTVDLERDALHSAGLPPAIADRLVGLKAGEEIAFDLVYPEFWDDSRLQGASVSFSGRVLKVLRPELPALDDALAARLAELATLDELRESVRGSLQMRAEVRHRNEHAQKAIDALVAGAKSIYAESILQAEVRDLLDDLRERVEKQGFTWERWLELQGDGKDKFFAEIDASAKHRLEQRLAVGEFMSREGIAVSRKEIDSEVRAYIASLSAAARRGLPPRAQLRRSIGAHLLERKMAERLLGIVRGEAGAATDQDE